MNYTLLLTALQGDMSQREMAAKLGFSQATWSRVMSGLQEPGREVIAALIREWPGHRQMILDLFFPIENAEKEAT
jgi:transcriptional regulator with XRE-family HTH domain